MIAYCGPGVADVVMRGLRTRTLHRSFAAASKLKAPASVDRPTARELLAASVQLPSLPPGKCIASLAEVTSAAVADKKEEDLLESQDFAALLQRVEDRLFGFSATEAYLLVSCLSRLSSHSATSGSDWPGTAAWRRLVQTALEQLAGEWGELGDTELAHAAQLLHRLAATSFQVDLLGLQRVLRVRAESARLSARVLCTAAVALAQRPQICLEEMALSLAAAAERLDRLSPMQLSSLALSLGLLGQTQAGFVADALQRLSAGPEELPIEALSTAVEAAAVSRQPEVLQQLLKHCAEVAHIVPASEAIRILRSCATLGLLTADLTQILLLQVAKVPLSALAEMDEKGLHQVMLSLLHDPTAADASRAIRASTDLWEACYRPEDIRLERSLASVAAPPDFAEKLQAHTGFRVEQAMSLADFYVLPLMLYAPDGSCVALDFDGASPPWLPHAEPPTQLFGRLKERHLALWQIPLVWLRTSSQEELENGTTLETATRRILEVHGQALYLANLTRGPR